MIILTISENGQTQYNYNSIFWAALSIFQVI